MDKSEERRTEMREGPMVSVIVPVYNAAAYLPRCLASLTEQTLTDFEVILIDDGSTDTSAAVGREWAARDSRIRIFCQTNAGVSVTRNRGLDESSGRYVSFVDADDWVLPDYLAGLCAALQEEKGAGLVTGGFVEASPDGELSEKGLALENRLWLPGEFPAFFRQEAVGRLGYVCSKLFDRARLERGKIRFRSDVRCSEDLLFTLEYMLQTDYIASTEARGYVYVKRPLSLSRTVHSFGSEWACFTAYRDWLRKAEGRLGLAPGEAKDLYASWMIVFRRTLKTDYLPEHRVASDQRRAHIVRVLDEAYDDMRRFYRPVYKIDRIGKWLLLHRWIRLYDGWVKGLFRLRVKAMFMGDRCAAGRCRKERS